MQNYIQHEDACTSRESTEVGEKKGWGMKCDHREGKHGTVPVRLLLHYSEASVNAIYVYLNVNAIVFSHLGFFFIRLFCVVLSRVNQEN